MALVLYFAAVIAFSHIHTIPWGFWTLGWAFLWIAFIPSVFLIGGYLVHRVPLSFIGTILAIFVAAFITPLAVPPALLAVFFGTVVMMRVLP